MKTCFYIFYSLVQNKKTGWKLIWLFVCVHLRWSWTWKRIFINQTTNAKNYKTVKWLYYPVNVTKNSPNSINVFCLSLCLTKSFCLCKKQWKETEIPCWASLAFAFCTKVLVHLYLKEKDVKLQIVTLPTKPSYIVEERLSVFKVLLIQPVNYCEKTQKKKIPPCLLSGPIKYK